MAETMRSLSIIFYVIAGTGAALALFFFLFFRIPAVIGDLSGRTARKSLARRRAANEKKHRSAVCTAVGRHPYDTNPMRKTAVEKTTASPEPVALKNSAVQDLMSRPETALLNISEAREMSPADEGNGETSLLNGRKAPSVFRQARQNAPGRKQRKLKKLEEVVLVHTDESL